MLTDALVFSATEEGVSSDLVAVKAAILYTENVKLASSRLYYALLSIQRQEGYSDELAALGRRVNLPPLGAEWPAHECSVMNTDVDEEEVLAVKELAKGLACRAFTVVPYREVLGISFDFMRGTIDTTKIIPILDQTTLERISGFTHVTLRKVEPDPPGPMADLKDVKRAAWAWLANEFIGHMPVLPDASWIDLLRWRDELRSVRHRFLSEMFQLARDMGVTPGEVADSAWDAWCFEVASKVADVSDSLKDLKTRPMLDRLIAAGTPNTVLAIGLAIAGSIALHHPEVGALSAPALTLAEVYRQEAMSRRKVKAQAKGMPFGFLHQLSDQDKLGEPIW
jgi:hypothetical protein